MDSSAYLIIDELRKLSGAIVEWDIARIIASTTSSVRVIWLTTIPFHFLTHVYLKVRMLPDLLHQGDVLAEAHPALASFRQVHVARSFSNKGCCDVVHFFDHVCASHCCKPG